MEVLSSNPNFKKEKIKILGNQELVYRECKAASCKGLFRYKLRLIDIGPLRIHTKNPSPKVFIVEGARLAVAGLEPSTMADSEMSKKLSTFLKSGIHPFEDPSSVFIDPVRLLNRSYTRFRVFHLSAYYSRFFQSIDTTQ
ncbi:hypothetical protein TorRG33x02_012200 [Trema orientale]|uniref:Uncharacterized protein n=1 Tax=Trema orientale TaxID=63057 RepID=A0A2P5FZH5_TREOI|nr:hypothetical protein TorRG33x02_012200 [Trema orientale]